MGIRNCVSTAWYLHSTQLGSTLLTLFIIASTWYNFCLGYKQAETIRWYKIRGERNVTRIKDAVVLGWWRTDGSWLCYPGDTFPWQTLYTNPAFLFEIVKLLSLETNFFYWVDPDFKKWSSCHRAVVPWQSADVCDRDSKRSREQGWWWSCHFSSKCIVQVTVCQGIKAAASRQQNEAPVCRFPAAGQVTDRGFNLTIKQEFHLRRLQGEAK